MSTTTVVAIIIVAAILVAFGAALLAMRRRRTSQLRDTFGPEYDRTVEQSDKRRDAERELKERKAAHDELDLRPLAPASRARYVEHWEAVQAKFVDAPSIALTEADHLVTSLLRERGYPTDDVDTSARMLSVEHTQVLDNFRSGHDIERASQANNATTEQVRQAMLHFRAVFEDLLYDDRDRTVDLTETEQRDHEDTQPHVLRGQDENRRDLSSARRSTRRDT